jgi:hypothetical protein
MLRKSLFVISITLIFSLILSTVRNHTFDFLSWTNILFLCSLLVAMVGGTLFVIQAGFFNGIYRSFKHFFSTISKAEQVIQDVEGKRDNVNPFKLEFGWTFPLLIAGLILFVFSLVLSFGTMV